MKKILNILTLSLFLSVTSCTSYKLEVQQGNAIAPEKVSQLKQGMSKAEVTALLGTPLLQDSFQQNRWDYVFYISNAGKQRERKDLILTFNGNRLANIKK